MNNSNNRKKKNISKSSINKKNSKQEKEIVSLKKKDISQKERNKKKYENSQKKYREKRKIEVEKKEKQKKEIQKIVKKQEKKEKVKIKSKDKITKEGKLKKNFEEFKSIGVDAYNTVREKTSDRSIPIGKNKNEKKKRIIRYLKEALVYAIIITFINLLSYVIFDYVNLLRLFDIKIFNVLLTIIVSLIIGFIFSFIIDYTVSELWVIIKRKRSGDTNGNKDSIKGEH